MTFSDFGKLHIPLVDSFIDLYFKGKIEASELPVMKELYRDLGEFINRDGKRVRPLLLLAAYYGYGGDTSASGEVIGIASILEIMHAMLLIQDDIVDKAALRRGKPAFHLLLGGKYSSYTHTESIGTDLALVLSDLLFADSLEILSDSSFDASLKNRFLRAFSETYQYTVWGQVLDSLYSMSKDIAGAKDAPMIIGRMKTAYYTIFYPLQMGYILTGRDDAAEIAAIKEFSIPLGFAFQLRDDILGVFGLDSAIGKPADSDIREGKLTLLVQYALQSMPDADRDRFLPLFLTMQKSDADVDAVREMVRATGAKDRAEERLAGLAAEARMKLASLSIDREYRDVLKGLIDLIGAA